MEEASDRNLLSRQKAVEAYNLRHADRMKRGAYKRGELVLVVDEALRNQAGRKGALQWLGPYAVVQQRASGAFVLQELDGAVLKQLVAWKRLKSYVPRRGLEPVVRSAKWLVDKDDIPLEKGLVGEAAIGQVGLMKPWELKGEELVAYWEGVVGRWNKRKSAQNSEEISRVIAEQELAQC